MTHSEAERARVGLFSRAQRLGFCWALTLALVAGAFIAMPTCVSADTEWTVCPSGCDFAELQPAIDGAAAGDSIKIATGDYTTLTTISGKTQIAYLDKSLTLRGGYSADLSEWNPELYPTRLDAQGNGRVIYITGAIDVALDGLQLVNGQANGGGAGIYAVDANLHLQNSIISGSRSPVGSGIGVRLSGGSLTMAQCTVTDSQPTSNDENIYYGGGLYALNATVNITDSTFTNNVLTNYGGIWHWGCGGGVALEECDSTLERLTFSGNLASRYKNGEGGGLYSLGGTLVLRDTTFSNNTAAATGDGVGGGAFTGTTNALIEGCTFTGNTTSQASGLTGRGGGLMVGVPRGTGTIVGVQVLDSVFADNRANDGGGLAAQTALDLTISGNEFSGNANSGVSILTAANMGGATAVELSDNEFTNNVTALNGGGAMIYGAVDVLGNTFTGNVAAGNGGGIFESETDRNNNATATYDGNLFAGNSALNGGGLYLSPIFSTNLRISYRNMAFVNNTASNQGGAIYFHRFAHDTTPFDFLTLANNPDSSGAMIYHVMGNVVYTNCILADAEVGFYRNSDSVTFDHVLRHNVTTPFSSPWALPFTDTAPVEGDPKFAADGYHLQRGSAAIDTGVATSVIDDIDGEPRPRGHGVDIGADESPYAFAESTIQASLLASTPRWRVTHTGVNVPPSTYLEQQYMIPYGNYTAETEPAIASYTITQELPAELALVETVSQPELDESVDGQTMTWRSRNILASGSSGWVSVVTRSDTMAGGTSLTSTGEMAYTLLDDQTGVIPLEVTVDVPERPLFPPVFYTPLDGEMCIDEGHTLSASGIAGTSMEVRLYENGALKSTTLTDEAGKFEMTWVSALDDDHTVTLEAISCVPETEQCSAPSRSVHLQAAEGNWCPQRSYWESNTYGNHWTFYFRNDEGRYATDDFLVPGFYGFLNTKIHLYSCCDENELNPFTITADHVVYTTPSAHDGHWWTFDIAYAHQVTVSTQCYSRGAPDGEERVINGQVLIDPDGFVFDIDHGGAYDSETGMFAPVMPLANMTVSCYQYVPDWDSWILWPAEQYQQINPQVTNSTGYFAFFTPPGQYYLQVDTVDGYQLWSSPVIEVVSEIVHVNVPLTPAPRAIQADVWLTPAGPNPAETLVTLGSHVAWHATLDEEASADELAAQMHLPVLRPRSTGLLDPLLDELGFDGGMLTPGQTYTRRFVGPGDYVYDDGLGHEGVIHVVPGITLPVIARAD